MSDTLLQTIKKRRTVRNFEPRSVSLDTLQTLIEAATWAPNHRSTEPWRFFVLEKGAKKRTEIADMVYEWTYSNVKNPNPKRRKTSAASARDEIMIAPAFIYVYSIPGRTDEITKENYAATCCAIQNLQLASFSLGLGVGWSTGKPCLLPGLKTTLGAKMSWQVVGALYIGYTSVQPKTHRIPVNKVTSWL